MKDANTSTKLAQPMGEYVPGIRDDEKAALEAMAKAKADFEQRRGHYDETASRHKFFVDQAADSADESRKVNLKIRANLRNPSEYSHKELITFRAEMRESLEMMENYRFLAEEVSGALADAKIRAAQAANEYRFAHGAAMELISDNMLEAVINSANSLNLYIAMHARMKVFQEMRPLERSWEKHGFDSAEDAVLADVNKRIALIFRSLDEDYMRQMFPPPIGDPFDVGDLGEGTPAAWKKASASAIANIETSAT